MEPYILLKTCTQERKWCRNHYHSELVLRQDRGFPLPFHMGSWNNFGQSRYNNCQGKRRLAGSIEDAKHRICQNTGRELYRDKSMKWNTGICLYECFFLDNFHHHNGQPDYTHITTTSSIHSYSWHNTHWNKDKASRSDMLRVHTRQVSTINR